MKNFIHSFFQEYFDLREGAERKAKIIESIKDDTEFRGANLWVLIFAIFIASIGLNINSIPIIIGAMLISPLMGPIVGAGLALAINDHGLLRRSGRSFLLAAVIGIVISTLYFLISPIGNAQSELLARTQPTIFDVMIAFFGGLAGFIAASRKEKSNVLPGVAIATALMPPLCTVGFGIATLQPQFIFGALYLFVINSIFICLATLLIAQLLKLPRRKYEDPAQAQQVRRVIGIVTVIVVIPAVYLAYTFVQRNNFNQNVNAFIENTFTDQGHVVIYRDTDFDASPKVIELAFLSESFTEEQMQQFQGLLPFYELMGVELRIRQDGFSISQEEWGAIVEEFRTEAERFAAIEDRLENRLEDLRGGSQILEEVQALAPNVTNIAIGTLAGTTEGSGQLVLVYESAEGTPLSSEDKVQLRNWLLTRLDDRGLQVNFLVE